MIKRYAGVGVGVAIVPECRLTRMDGKQIASRKGPIGQMPDGEGQ